MPKPPPLALLIGVPSYDDEEFEDLPFISDDLDKLEKALLGAGYTVRRHPHELTDRDRIDNAIEMLCRTAESGQQLLIFLSGHGIHRDGRDYLVPSSADTTSRKFVERCVEIDFNGHIEDSRSRCGDVVVVVDACREGVKLREKGTGYAYKWSMQERRRSANRRIAYVYACSSGEVARWAEGQGGPYSLFTHAFSRAVTDSTILGSLTGIRDEVQRQLDDLTATIGKPPQNITVRGDDEQISRIQLVGRPAIVGPFTEISTWPEISLNHVVWSFTRTGVDPGNEPFSDDVLALREVVVDLSRSWAIKYRGLRSRIDDDPWWDDQLAARIHIRLNWIIGHLVNPGKLIEAGRSPLSPAEAALLVLLPFAQQLHRLGCAVGSCDVVNSPESTESPQARRFSTFVRGEGRLYRRLIRLDEKDAMSSSAASIRWWLFHRWLARIPDSYHEDRITSILFQDDDVSSSRSSAELLLQEVVSSDRIARLLRALRSDPGATSSPHVSLSEVDPSADDPPSARTVAGGSPHEQILRERLIALLLLAAGEFAIDVTALPDVLVEHVASSGVQAADALATVRKARWAPRGRTRVLEADCSHQAVEVALSEHVGSIAEVLRRIDAAAGAGTDNTLAALQDLPTHTDAGRLRPSTDESGRPRYDEIGFRFRLDDERVQELLMGEQLYGDPALAVRELYQNALDACRYRRARMQYIEKCEVPVSPWNGSITFSHGIEDGRPWLECVDNGIGMTEKELSSVFFYAGARFADLPAFLEEYEVWASAGIDFFPNSRFGVGVLSYFMLGDEIKVSSTRFHRDGNLGTKVEVAIDGPGSLCHIQRVGPGSTSGTTVRVYLRPDVSVSCVDLLSRVLWVSEFSVRATDGDRSVQWQPGVISTRAPIGAEDPFELIDQGELTYTPATIVQQTSVDRVWWCDTLGARLADGLWAGDAPHGQIVNLTRDLAPQLTVDRRRILYSDDERESELVHAAVPDLICHAMNVVTPSWLSRLSLDDIGLADAVAREAIVQSASWPVGNDTVGTGLVGCFPPDGTIFSARSSVPYPPTHWRDERRLALLVAWRLKSYIAHGLVPGVTWGSAAELPPMLPSDVFLLSINGSQLDLDLDFEKKVPAARVVAAAARLQWPATRAAARLQELGALLPAYDWPQTEMNNFDYSLLLAALYTDPTWHDLSIMLPAQNVLFAAARLEWSVVEVATRLRELGVRIPDQDWPEFRLSEEDQRLLTPSLRGVSLVDLNLPLVPAQVIVAALDIGWSASAAMARLSRLGASVPDYRWPTDQLVDLDRVLVTGNRNNEWVNLEEPISKAWVIVAAAASRNSPSVVAERLRKLGATVDECDYDEIRLSADDQRLLSRDLDGSGPWVDIAGPLSFSHIVIAALSLDRSPLEISARFAELEIEVALPPGPAGTLGLDDRKILSQDISGYAPWLPTHKPVPAAHILAAAAEVGQSPSAVASRLREFDLTVPELAWPSDGQLSWQDRILISVNATGKPPWIPLEEALAVSQIMALAGRTGSSAAAVATRFAELGVKVPAHDWSDDILQPTDWLLIALPWLHDRIVRYEIVWPDISRPLELYHLAPSINGTRLTVAQAARRMQQLGFMLPPEMIVESQEGIAASWDAVSEKL